jgi:hypothetical protein
MLLVEFLIKPGILFHRRGNVTAGNLDRCSVRAKGMERSSAPRKVGPPLS